jgi:Rha family phage regulatory protein
MELVIQQNGKLVTSSRMIADKFGKRHDNILRAIQNIECSEEFNALNFEVVEHIDNKGEKRPEYIVSRDGFSFLVMGFTGKEAAKFKEEFISAFNEMERAIKQIQKPTEDQLLLEAMNILNKRIETQSMQLQLANNTILEQAPIVKYAKQVLDSHLLIKTNDIAMDLNMTANKLNKLLVDRGIQYRQSDGYYLFAKYREKGYAHSKTYPVINSNGNQVTARHLYWTQRGKAFIMLMLAEKVV